MEPASNPPVLGGTLPADRIFIVFVFLGFKLILVRFLHLIEFANSIEWVHALYREC